MLEAGRLLPAPSTPFVLVFREEIRRGGYVAVLLGFILLWEYFGDQNSIVRLFISSPSRVFSYATENAAELFRSFRYTALESLLGLIVAIFSASCLSFFCLISTRLRAFLLPLATISQTIPLITLAPFFILLFGIGIVAKVAMAALLSFFPLFIAIVVSVQNVPTPTRDLLKIYGASRVFSVVRVFVPISMPHIMAGLRVSATLAVVGALVSEFMGSEAGLGRNLYLAARRLEPELLVSSVILASGMSLGIQIAVRKIESVNGWWTVNTYSKKRGPDV
jgi:NitT/TauT family transport system permease protein